MPARDKKTPNNFEGKNDRSSKRGEIPIRGRDMSARGGSSSESSKGTGLTSASNLPGYGTMRRLSDEMSRFFGNFGFGTDLSTSFDRGLSIPQVDVLRRGDDLVVRADLPGLSKENISIDVSGDVLTIRGERRDESREEREGYYWHERSSGSFARRIPLPENADVDHASASFENGVLEVRLPAPESNRSRDRHINIR